MALNYSNLSSGNPKAIDPMALGKSLQTPAYQSLLQGFQSPKPLVPAVTKPTTAVKKVTNTDGSIIEYHKPDTTVKSTTPVTTAAPAYSQTAQDPNTPPGVPAATGSGPLLSGPGTPQPQDTSYPALIQSQANIGANGSQGYNDAIAYQRQLQSDIAKQTSNIEAGGYLPMNFVGGREQSLRNQFASQLDAAQQAVNAQQVQQGQQITALQNTANLAKPTGVEPSTTLVNPQTLQAGYGLGTANNPGGGTSTGANNLAAYGALQQNVAQGQQYQGQATEIDTALKQLDAITPAVTGFLSTSGLNSTSNPDVNAALNTYYGKFLNPGNKAIFEQYIGDIKKYTGQILATNTGTIPTDISNTLATFDPTNLSAEQLGPYLQNLSQLGSLQRSVQQSQATASYGSGTTPYTGTPSTTATQNIQAPASGNTVAASYPKPAQAVLGGAMNFFGGIGNSIGNLFSHIFGE